jgi:hypothetical protein
MTVALDIERYISWSVTDLESVLEITTLDTELFLEQVGRHNTIDELLADLQDFNLNIIGAINTTGDNYVQKEQLEERLRLSMGVKQWIERLKR